MMIEMTLVSLSNPTILYKLKTANCILNKIIITDFMTGQFLP